MFLTWLDPDIHKSVENRRIQHIFRTNIDRFLPFDNLTKCKKMIEDASADCQIILIVSGKAGRELVPQIHEYQQVLSIYVYCKSKSFHEEWAKLHTKIRRVIDQENILLDVISFEKRIPIKFEDSISFKISCTNDDTECHTMTKSNHEFINSAILINAICRLKSDVNDKSRMIAFFERKYKKTEVHSSMIQQLSDQYTSDKAIWFYRQESFLYHAINNACYTGNLSQLHLLHFIIKDIYQQLKANHQDMTCELYYSEMISNDKLEILKTSKDKLILINSFFIANTDRNTAMKSVNNSNLNKNEYQVLFIIDFDTNPSTRTAYALISRQICSTRDGEVLFMIGSIFRLMEIDVNESLSIIRMRLCNNNEEILRCIDSSIKYISKTNDSEIEIDLPTYAGIVFRLHKYDDAEYICFEIINKSSSYGTSAVADAYCLLGNIQEKRNKLIESLTFYSKSIEIKLQGKELNLYEIGKLWSLKGLVYCRLQNETKAIECCKKAIDNYTKATCTDKQHLAVCYSNIGLIYKNLQNFTEALELYKKSLDIYNEYSCNERINKAKTLNDLGIVYCNLGEYELALEHCHMALSINFDILPPKSLSIGKTYRNIGVIHEMRGDLQNALENYQKAHDIHQMNLLPKHRAMIEVKNDIENIIAKLN